MSDDKKKGKKNKEVSPEEQLVMNEYMNRIAGAESGYTMIDKKTGKVIKNPKGSASGPFQFVKATWGQMEKNLGRTLKKDSWEDNISAMKELSRINIKKLNDAGLPVNEKNLYMLHFLGDSGGSDFLKKMKEDPNALASKYVSKSAFNDNENVFVNKETGKERTAAEVFNLMAGKVNSPAKYDIIGSNGKDFKEIDRSAKPAPAPVKETFGRQYKDHTGRPGHEWEKVQDNTRMPPIKPEGLPQVKDNGLNKFINPVERNRASLGMTGDGLDFISPEAKLAFTEEQQAEGDIENEEYARMGGHQMTMSNSFRNGGNPGKKKTVEQMMEEKKNALYSKKDSDGLNTSHSKYREDSEIVDNKGKKYNTKGEEMVIGKSGSYSKKLDPKKIKDKSSVDGKEYSDSNDTGSKVKRTAEAVAEASVISKVLNKHPVAETAYDVYNLGNSFVEGDLRGMAANSIGALLPTVSGKTIEASVSEFIPETSESNRNRFKTSLSLSKTDNYEYLKKYGQGYMSNPEFIKNEGAKHGINEENKYESGGNLTEFNEGGSHEQNPIGGIPQGMGSNGKLNTVEEGETKLKESNYILSDTLKVNDNDAEDLQLPKDVIGMTYAEASKFINRVAKENPGDSLIQKDAKESLDRLTMGNEKARLDYEELMSNFGMDEEEGEDDQEQMFLGGFSTDGALNSLSSIAGGLQKGFQNNPSLKGSDVGEEDKFLAKENDVATGSVNPALAGKSAMDGATKTIDGGGAGEGAGAGIGAYANLGTTALDLGSSAFGKSKVDSSGATEPGKVDKTGMALSGAAKGAQAGAMFGPWGAAIGGVVGLGAGLIGGGKAAKAAALGKQRFDIGQSNSKISSFRDGGSLEDGGDPPVNNKLFDPTKEDFLPVRKITAVNNDDGSKGYRYFYDKLPEEEGFDADMNSHTYTSDEHRLKQDRRSPEYSERASQYLSKTKGMLNRDITKLATGGELGSTEDNNELYENMNLSKTNKFRVGDYLDRYRTSRREDDPNYEEEKEEKGVPAPYKARGEDPLRYSGLVGAGLNYLEDMNAKPSYISLGRLSDQYNPNYTDVKALENNARNEANSQIGALSEMGLSKGQLISNTSGANFNKNKSVSDSMFRAEDVNRSEDRLAYDSKLRNSQFNIGQMDKETDINQMEDDAVRDRKRESRDAMFLSAGELGKENTYKNRIFNMTGGYDTQGKFENINGKTYENVDGNLILVDRSKEQEKKRTGGLLGKYSEYLKEKLSERQSIEGLNN